MSEENLMIVLNMIKLNENNENSCIIIDDMTSYLKDKNIVRLLKELIFNRRHLHTSIYFLCQTYKSININIRKCFSNLFIFKTSKMELEKIFEELIEQNKKIAGDLAKLVFDKPYQFLFVNTGSQRLFKCFDEIIIKN